MEIKEKSPIVLFDDQCYVCIKFATIVNFLARGKITMIGHYSNFGIKIRNEILDESALEMFWFIDEKRASGGRAALFPLIKSIFSTKTKKSKFTQIDNICSQNCKSTKSVFVRSFTLITNSKKIDL
jgi:predicted DCC family thiol-disulfide oxidoreductase YuxK|tara:strand:+ start:53 stop:430 length:378 start_codon:yes stop_codon:yes gene_type:complete